MSKTKRAIDLPIYQPRSWGKPSNARPLPGPWYGLDTERDAKKGTFVCGKIWNPNHTGGFVKIQDLPIGTYFIWNLGYDIEGMIRDLDVEEGWAMKSDGAGFQIGLAKCRYYHGKRFEWRDEKGLRLFIEAASFFNRIPLKKAAKIIGEEKMGGVDASKMSLARYRREAGYRKTVDEYCIQDARVVWLLVDKIATGLRRLHPPIEIGGTPGATARRFIAQLPAFPRVIWNTQREFLRAYCGGRFELVKRGYFERASQFDIVSAYPWALSKCPHLSPNAYSKRASRVSDAALYGAYEVEFDCPDYFGVAPMWRGQTRVFSAGEKRAWVSKPELELIHEWGGKYKVLGGTEIFDESADNAWERLLAPLFKVKQEKKKEPEGLGAKVVLNSVYGGLIQLIPKGGQWVPIAEAKNPTDFAGELALDGVEPAFEGGKYYAPCYASHLTSLVRRKVLETCAQIGAENVVGAHTDSILCVKGGPRLGTDLGEWTLEEDAEELFILKTGQYAIGDKIKARGIRSKQKEALWAERHERTMRISVKSAEKWSDVSLIKSKSVANNIGWELKRVWERELTTKAILNREWIESAPLRAVGKCNIP